MSPAAAPAITPFRKALITATLMSGPIMQVLDSSMLAVSLKHMQGSLSAAHDQMAWVLTSYLISVAVTTPLWGALTDHFSRKGLFMVGLVGFTLTSILCGTADTLTEMLVYRTIQGVFGAGLIPLSQAALMDVYDPKDYGVAMGWWGIGLMFGPILGPTLGGYVTEWYNWRWAFFINVPFGVVGLLMTWWLLPLGAARRRRQFNYFGFLMLAVGVACLQFVLDRGTRLDWLASNIIITLLCVGAAAFWLFLVNSIYSRHPFVDPLLLVNRNFVIGLVLRAVFGLILFGSLILVPPFLQTVGGYPLIDSGLIMAPRGLATMISAYIVGRLVRHFDAKLLIAIGLTMAAASAWYMSKLTPDSTAAWVIWLNVIQGFGVAWFFVPLNTVAFATMPAEQRDLGTSFFALTGNIGRSIGIAILSSYLGNQSQVNRARLTEHATPFNDLFSHVPLPPSWALGETTGLAALERTIDFQAVFLAYASDFRLLAAILFCCLPLTLLLSTTKKAASA
ncbi:MAG: DHA2 family efflux MFS transporter permease subunit [Magnetovibrio sp.]|nr:DHA2 family efflux MFS transporter permease subunit [Magnetovibrio sp.]